MNKPTTNLRPAPQLIRPRPTDDTERYPHRPTSTARRPTTDRRLAVRSAFGVATLAGAAAELVAVAARVFGVPMRAGTIGASSPAPLPPGLVGLEAAVGVLVGAVLAGASRKRARRPRRTFQWLALSLTALSLVSPIAAGATETATKTVLALTHIVVAAIAIPQLSSRLPAQRLRPFESPSHPPSETTVMKHPVIGTDSHRTDHRDPRPTADTTQLGVVLLAGLAGSTAEFDAQKDHFAGDRTVITIEPPTSGDTSLAGQSQRALTLIDQHGVERAVIIGHSAGGILALELARSHPQRIAGVVLLDAPVLVPTPVRTVAVLIRGLLRTPLARPVLRWFFNATFRPADAPEFRTQVLARLDATPTVVARRSIDITFGYNSTAALESLSVPALVVKANVPTRLDRLPDGVESAEIRDVGHWVHVHSPDALNSLLDRFLNKVEARST